MTDITLEQRADRLFDAMMAAPYGNTCIGDVVCAETTASRLRAAWLPLIEAALRLSAGADWVLCSERLPERKGPGAVLAFDAARPEKDPWVETIHPSWWGKPYDHVEEVGPTITHWQPLPAAPRHEPGEVS